MDGRTIRIGVDVGGTNTDICAIDEKSGELMVYKLPSSLHDQSAAVVEGVKVIAEEYGFSGEDVSRFMHGTTVATNAILEGGGTLFAFLVPWSAAAIYSSGVLGVSAVEYLPFAFLPLICPITAVVCAITGIGVFDTEGKSLRGKTMKKVA